MCLLTKAFANFVPFFFVFGPLAFKEAEASSCSLWPPKLPRSRVYAKFKTIELLKPYNPLRKEVEIAREPPEVLFMYYPCQSYPGKPWSNWGDGLCKDCYYFSSLGDHMAPEGNAFVYRFDSEKKSLCMLLDLRSLLNLPPGYYTPGKIHGALGMGKDGWIYFSTHRGSTRVTTPRYHFKGDWIIRVNPENKKAEVVVHAPVPMQCIPCLLYTSPSPRD